MSNYVPDPQMVAFFESEIAPLITSLINGNYCLPEIQREFSENLNVICNKYGSLNIELCDKPPKHITKNGFLPFGFRMNQGKPVLIIFVQQLKILFNDFAIRRWHDFRQCFENIVIVGLMHEIYHIQLEQLVEGGVFAKDDDNTEVVVWALTCENAMRLLVELYHKELFDSDYQTYSMWVQCGRNVKNPQWKEFIADLYSNIGERR